MIRGWINQPSTLQPLHKLHGTNVLVETFHTLDGREGKRVWFLSGDVISMEVPSNVISKGWLKEIRQS